MTGSPDEVGTHTWVERTGGLLTGAERRALLRPIASAHVTNAVGRLSMIVGSIPVGEHGWPPVGCGARTPS